jgi:hypothetical protein
MTKLRVLVLCLSCLTLRVTLLCGKSRIWSYWNLSKTIMGNLIVCMNTLPTHNLNWQNLTTTWSAFNKQNLHFSPQNISLSNVNSKHDQIFGLNFTWHPNFGHIEQLKLKICSHIALNIWDWKFNPMYNLY